MGLQDVNLQHAGWHRYVLYALQLTDMPFIQIMLFVQSPSTCLFNEIQGQLAGLEWLCVKMCLSAKAQI